MSMQREARSNFWKRVSCVRLSEIGTGVAGCEGQKKGRGEPMPSHPLCFHAVWKKHQDGRTQSVTLELAHSYRQIA